MEPSNTNKSNNAVVNSSLPSTQGDSTSTSRGGRGRGGRGRSSKGGRGRNNNNNRDGDDDDKQSKRRAGKDGDEGRGRGGRGRYVKFLRGFIVICRRKHFGWFWDHLFWLAREGPHVSALFLDDSARYLCVQNADDESECELLDDIHAIPSILRCMLNSTFLSQTFQGQRRAWWSRPWTRERQGAWTWKGG